MFVLSNKGDGIVGLYEAKVKSLAVKNEMAL